MIRLGLLFLCLFLPGMALAEPGIPALTLSTGEDGSQSYSLTLQILALMTVLTLLPAALLMMTSFTRIIIVLAILRQAMGVQSTPSNQIMIGLALFLTFFIMSPVFSNAYENGVKPYLDGDIEATAAIEQVSQPFREFMLAQTRESDIELFAEIGGYAAIESADEVPFTLLLPAFVTSELKTAFQIGFLIFVPFLIIDLVVASVLMAMGMMMLSPMLISLPFKLMLFVLIDGWALLMGTLASSFYI
ncbi:MULTISPECIES: flagellar type III secretion system pore protein FliP [unclassified Methylophaga]|uniref:flagellar type III secretion system pore protein FliP n=1 Tax=unclassified Methylophaga TaxID=2629249 RepID=UPI000C8F06EB|nr:MULTISPECIES: flagellar type III secretion system pore protein FliP [unclassified Methylophaga]MAK66497.1 flagellar biosynthetic protein FliP [Methylophaga sp.]MAY17190.1 flagellar biosynthetic protein FliP [Methylophaga sp.]MBN46016.1 flagellar biosynthetic protein FliP [Methylophaga sp.]|tara:strand:- start:6983 stop:7720 length:738 start_codon:yes stop_codon:yes gene_type:complete